MKRRAAEMSQKALDLWQPPEGVGDALHCVATSFTFDATFFETECVGRFLQMSTHPSESETVGYLIEREEKLAAANVCALVDRGHARDKESLRWDVLGVLVPRAIQHAKVALLAWSHHVRVIVGSGNLTEPGYRKNLEVFGAIDVSRREGGDRESVLATIEFLDRVLDSAVGSEIEGQGSAKARARASLRAVRVLIARWPHVTPTAGPTPVFGLPDQGVLPRVLEEHWPSDGRPPRWAWIVSPFFDRPGSDTDVIRSLVDGMAKRGERNVAFHVRGDTLPDGRIRIFAPKAMVDAARRTCETEVCLVAGKVDDDLRPLHAKLLCLQSDQWSLHLIGSSNFTTAGLLADGRGNLEANLLYRVRTTDPLYDQLDAVWPELAEEAIDPDSESLIWDPEDETAEGGGDITPLPACFREVVYRPGVPAILSVQLKAELPAEWSIRVPNGALLLSSSSGHGAGEHDITWIDTSPPFVLEVSWRDAGSEWIASWPVNVSNPAALPPPAELRNLTLDELLEILGSSRPLSDAVVHVLRKRGRTVRGPNGVELDPLKRLDSPSFLLRRAKRVAAALERLRERLERPVSSRESFEWRLRGAVGPTALAERFVAEATFDGEAGFYLAELGLTLGRVDVTLAAEGGLRRDLVKASLDGVIAELRRRAMEVDAKPVAAPLDAYVSAAFERAVRQ
jgi:hypothetical protein